MSKAYREEKERKKKVNMRQWCQRPGEVDEKGNPLYVTQQDHKNRCDINRVIRRYTRTGTIQHVSTFEKQFGDVTGIDFKSAMDLTVAAQQTFDELPAYVRKEFQNDPGKLLEFMEKPENRERAIELGLIDQTWTPETDGLGEHITDDSQRRHIEGVPDPKPAPPKKSGQKQKSD